jgi:spermidine/putrescine transport system substrate-binding protein
MGLRISQGRALAAGALTGALTLSAAGAAMAQDEAPDLSGQSLVISNWEGYMPDDLPQRFEEATGVPVTVANHATNEEIVATLTASANPGIDVAFVSGQFAQALGEIGLLEPLDHAQIPNLANLYPEANELAYDPGNAVSAPYAWGTTGLCYRGDLIDAPTSWNDLLQPAEDVSGKTTMLATERWLMLPAQKALGYSVNTTDDAELAEIQETLIAAKEHLLGYDDTTFYEKLISGEAVMTEAWDGWCGYGMAENPDIKFVVPDEGSDLWVDTMVVLKGSENKEAAMAFINMMLEPETHAWVTENVYYNVPNEAAGELVPAELKEQFPQLDVTPDELAEGESLIDLGEDSTKYTELTTEVTAS